RMRRQALVLLRVVCSHMAVRSCVATLDSLGPSIVSDIPSIAASAAHRLTGAVAASFAAHSELAILECVRQVHAQGGVAGRLAALLEVVQPWVGNIELRSVAADGSEGLGPVALSRDSLVVLRCILFLTVRAGGVEALAAVQGLWVGLAHSSGNLWLAMRHLTGLLLHTQSLALLAFMRRIAVFLTRSSPPLVRRLVAEARNPAAHAPVEAESIVAHNAINEVLPNEPWTAEFAFAPRRTRVMVSTGALAIYYLAAVSYEQPALVSEDLAVLPPALFALANPERWVRDAARTLLVNLVAAERASAPLAADAAQGVLGVLRGDECAAGFGNVDDNDDDDEVRRKAGTSPDDYALRHAWSPMATGDASAAADDLEANADDVPEDGGDTAAIDVTLPPLPLPLPPQGLARSQSTDHHAGELGGAGRERAALQRLFVQLSRLFHARQPACAQEWAAVAVRWAMRCRVRPLAALALQVFSVLAAEAHHGTVAVTPTRSMVLHLIDRLSNVVGHADLSAFADSVLAALRQTAALAARMCGADVRADLLAASVVLMATAQTASVYAMAVAVFERIFPLVEHGERGFWALIAERVGPLFACGYQGALLRGLEFASCRDRCLWLLRDTLKYEERPTHPMLAITAHLPTIIEDAAQTQNAHLSGETRESVGADMNPAPSGHRHGTRRAPSFSNGALPPGASLGLMFASVPNGHRSGMQQQSRRQLFRRRGPHNAEHSPDAASRESLLPPEPPSISSSAASCVEDAVRDKYVGFISECTQTLLSGQQEMRVFVQRLLALFATSSAETLPRDKAAEVVKQFGYAVVESGHAPDIIAILLRLLAPSARTRLMLKYDQQRRSPEDGEGEDVRKILSALRLLHSVLAASNDPVRLDAALMPSLRHLFDLLIVARPISDMATQVLTLLMQRFDDLPADPAVGSWYETDALVLQDLARSSLARIVELGMDDDEEFVGSVGTSLRSVSPEMPVLVLDSSNDSHLADGLRGASRRGSPEGVSEDAELMGKHDDDMLAQLDMFDRELDEALRA
ncbi:hypothetical protein FBU31_002233, partial [Coemansia sp. 'formosensis']